MFLGSNRFPCFSEGCCSPSPTLPRVTDDSIQAADVEVPYEAYREEHNWYPQDYSQYIIPFHLEISLFGFQAAFDIDRHINALAKEL